MSELIRREDAINAVEMFFKDAYIEDADVHCTDMVYEINHIPTASPWHRVEEEMPKDNTWCVFISENKHNFEQYRWIGTYSEEWGFQDDDNFMVDNVKCWMPLPEPPREDA